MRLRTPKAIGSLQVAAVAWCFVPREAYATEARAGELSAWTVALTFGAFVAAFATAAFRRARRAEHAAEVAERCAAELRRNLAEATARSEELARTKDQLLDHTVAALRDPLGVLVANLDALVRSPLLGFEVRTPVVQALSLGRETAANLTALGDVSRLRHGEFALDRMATDVRGTIESALEIVHRNSDAAGQRFDVDAASDTPYADADPERLTQALTTLFDRAARVAQGRAVCVRVRRDGDVIVIVVEDGRAMAEPDLSLLSSPALPSAAGDVPPSTALRLWVAGRVLLQHGHAVECAPRTGDPGFSWRIRLPCASLSTAAERKPRGTELIPTLPAPPSGALRFPASRGDRIDVVSALDRARALAPTSVPRLDFSPATFSANVPRLPELPKVSLVPPASLIREARELRHEPSGGPPSSRRKSAHVPDSMPIAPDPMLFRPRVLVADDDPVVRHVIAAELSELDVDVTTATDGVDALAQIQSDEPYDLILSDVIMPRLTGLQLCKIVRETHTRAELPIVLMSSNVDQGDVVRAFEAGASDFVGKPTVKEELLQRLATHLQIARENVALSRFVPREFLRLLGRERVADVRLGDHVSKELTVLFTDIRGFTGMSETFGPAGTFKFLNGCLSRLAPHIRESGGFIDKYIGDAVMAIFPTSALGAVRAALAIQREVDLYNDELGLAYDSPDALAVGVGIFRGPTMLGTIGEPKRLEATVISDTVNVAARLESLTRSLGVRVLIGESVLEDIADSSLTVRPLGRVLARGRGEAVPIWELLDADPVALRDAKLESLNSFNAAVEAFERNAFSAAAAAFDSVLERNLNDGPSWVYQQACQRFLTSEVPNDFRGALDLRGEK